MDEVIESEHDLTPREAARSAAQDAVRGYGVGVDAAADAAFDTTVALAFLAVYKLTNLDVASAMIEALKA